MNYASIENYILHVYRNVSINCKYLKKRYNVFFLCIYNENLLSPKFT